ncbi:Ubiquitin family protein [Trichomonas vaginalis G3]|uniref:Ubiquitin family protein n=1 Tax=Trichomonas vaginalis (strain ATCC PRA-98 / G3) TaxID=412133 RepID=A2F977_TRIV3|nr:ubiquitin-like family [Trichomonas vaginalis G3]EAX98555.1 Ubiquitin family protein [Trichomonas vaginalis G3]KAI5553054.1 ubiquitin-like family [Trichomonas vaginalis G3]|eukprot:XP_001311485.1 Ubiquitin family protein [Trichomonas vaginalis G3]
MEYHIRCNVAQGGSYDIDISRESIVNDLKKKISSKTGIPVEDQFIVYMGRVLDNPLDQLEACCINENFLIHVFSKSFLARHRD